MKTIQEIAKFILERRMRASPIVMTGEVVAALESEGMLEALQRRWLVPEYEGGNLQVTTDLGRIAELEETANLPPEQPKPIEDSAAPLAIGHANRPPRYLSEINAPGLGRQSASQPMTPPAPASPTAPVDKREPGVGDDAAIAEGGRTYTGKVASRTPQGKFTLSFGPEKPPVSRDYDANELRLTPPAHA